MTMERQAFRAPNQRAGSSFCGLTCRDSRKRNVFPQTSGAVSYRATARRAARLQPAPELVGPAVGGQELGVGGHACGGAGAGRRIPDSGATARAAMARDAKRVEPGRGDRHTAGAEVHETWSIRSTREAREKRCDREKLARRPPTSEPASPCQCPRGSWC